MSNASPTGFARFSELNDQASLIHVSELAVKRGRVRSIFKRLLSTPARGTSQYSHHLAREHVLSTLLEADERGLRDPFSLMHLAIMVPQRGLTIPVLRVDLLAEMAL
jgi:hypothetical protein